jgi:hypothetical protein
MAVNSNLHNIRSLIVGAEVEFAFAEAPATATLAQIGGPLYPFKDFGNLSVVDFTSEAEFEKRITSYRGIRTEISAEPTLTRFNYKLKSNELDPVKAAIALNASEGGSYTQSALAAAACQAIDFTVAPAVIGQWYQVRTAAGVAVRNITVLAIATKVENTDFVVDKALGRVRFLTAQTTSLATTITTSAVTAAASDPLGMNLLTPRGKPIRRGYGRIMLWDRDASNNLVYDHYDFSCELVVDSGGINSQDGKASAEVTFMITVTDQPGTIQIRS